MQQDELHRVKANSNNPTGWDPRKSLNILKSLIHPRPLLPQVDEDGDEMMEIDEEAVEKLCIQVGLGPAGSADENYVDEGRSIIEQGTEDTDVDMEEAISEQAENREILISSCAKPARNTSGFFNVDANICHEFTDLNESFTLTNTRKSS